jgi:hypothetical protein
MTPRPDAISRDREDRARYRLVLCREYIGDKLPIPFITAEMVLPDPLMEDIVNNTKYIVAETKPIPLTYILMPEFARAEGGSLRGNRASIRSSNL